MLLEKTLSLPVAIDGLADGVCVDSNGALIEAKSEDTGRLAVEDGSERLETEETCAELELDRVVAGSAIGEFHALDARGKLTDDPHRGLGQG